MFGFGSAPDRFWQNRGFPFLFPLKLSLKAVCRDSNITGLSVLLWRAGPEQDVKRLSGVLRYLIPSPANLKEEICIRSRPKQETAPRSTAWYKSNLNDAHDGTDTRSNPETPTEEVFAINRESVALKRVQSEQGTTTSARSHLNSPVLRFGEPAIPPSLNCSLINTGVSPQKPLPAHGLPVFQHKHRSKMIYTPQSVSGTRHPRAMSRSMFHKIEISDYSRKY